MEWFETAAALTERSKGNVRYDAVQFAAIVRKYDADKNKRLSAQELSQLLSAMTARYGVRVDAAQAGAILQAQGFGESAAISAFSHKIVQARRKSTETFTRLMASMLQFTTKSAVPVDCVKKDPFQQGVAAPLAAYMCKAPAAPALAAAKPENTQGGECVQAPASTATIAATPAPQPVVAPAETPKSVAPSTAAFSGLAINGKAKNGTTVVFLMPHDHDHEG